MNTPRFLYFDLGRVLVDFSHEQMFAQIAAVAGVEPDRVERALREGDLNVRYECGEISTEQFYDEFCRAISKRPPMADLVAAASAIFSLKPSMVPVIAGLGAAGWPLGILSNTCEAHWKYCIERFRLLTDGLFRVHALSYEIGAMKPDAAIFRTAAELVGVKPEEIFYTDDLPGHVEGARAAGFDAVVYTSTPELVAELQKRGVRFNY